MCTVTSLLGVVKGCAVMLLSVAVKCGENCKEGRVKETVMKTTYKSNSGLFEFSLLWLRQYRWHKISRTLWT